MGHRREDELGVRAGRGLLVELCRNPGELQPILPSLPRSAAAAMRGRGQERVVAPERRVHHT